MKKFLFLTETDNQVQLLVSNTTNIDDAVRLCSVTLSDRDSFHHLWYINKGRYGTISSQQLLESSNTVTLPCVCFEEKELYCIHYEVTEVNRLVGLFAFLKSWFELYGCHDVDYKILYV